MALTDDGPHPYWTPRVLDVLAEFEVPATFNMTGVQVPGNARLVQRIVAAGHQIADHTLNHPLNLPALPAPRIRQEIAEAHDRIAQAASAAPRFFRAPGGAWSRQVVDNASSLGMICVGWGVDPRDWDRPGVPHITACCCADFPRLAHVWADQGYRGQAFIEWVREDLDVQIEVVAPGRR
ncbi:polysaccharide deacetylase family protein [Actinomadura litoris]|uniref:polysaccharide deacetylase family protein n=1 Tax=Actinomadura litoris TaxID=2678616 RepID=UPI001FA6E805